MTTTNIPDGLREQALAAVRATDPTAENRRAQAVKMLRDATTGQYGPFPLSLPELIPAVDWALAQDHDPARYLTDYDRATGQAQPDDG